MRRLALSLLLASALIPAAATAGPNDEQRQRHSRATEDSSGGSGGGQRQRSQRSSGAARDDDGGQRQRAPRSLGNSDNSQRPAWIEGRGGMSEARSGEAGTDGPRRRRGSAGQGEATADAPAAIPAVQQQQQQQVATERRRERRRDRGGDSGQVSSGGTVPSGGITTAHRRDRNWSTHWRNDRRYDWRRHRDHNRSLFRLGFYYDPYGYNYRRWMVGWNMWPSYYRSSFWLNDPWMYRLPPAYGPYRWVRYWDDALLINTYTGEVVDVLYNFFW